MIESMIAVEEYLDHARLNDPYFDRLWDAQRRSMQEAFDARGAAAFVPLARSHALRIVCAHESGHAVACVALGGDLESVAVWKLEKNVAQHEALFGIAPYAGRTLYPNSHFANRVIDCRAEPLSAIACMTVTLAGKLAEEDIAGCDARFSSQDEVDWVAVHARQFCLLHRMDSSLFHEAIVNLTRDILATNQAECLRLARTLRKQLFLLKPKLRVKPVDLDAFWARVRKECAA